jgi:hypothetical protein
MIDGASVRPALDCWCFAGSASRASLEHDSEVPSWLRAPYEGALSRVRTLVLDTLPRCSDLEKSELWHLLVAMVSLHGLPLQAQAMDSASGGVQLGECPECERNIFIDVDADVGVAGKEKSWAAYVANEITPSQQRALKKIERSDARALTPNELGANELDDENLARWLLGAQQLAGVKHFSSRILNLWGEVACPACRDPFTVIDCIEVRSPRVIWAESG